MRVPQDRMLADPPRMVDLMSLPASYFEAISAKRRAESPDQITLELEPQQEEGLELVALAPKTSRSSRRKPTPLEYHCGCCGRRLRDERWIYSTHTGARFCWPGECKTEKKGR